MKIVEQFNLGGSEWSLLSLDANIPTDRAWNQVKVDGEPVEFSLPTGRLGKSIGVKTSVDLTGKSIEFV